MHHLAANKKKGEKFDGDNTETPSAVLSKTWKQLYGHLPLISQTIQKKYLMASGRDKLSSDKVSQPW